MSMTWGQLIDRLAGHPVDERQAEQLLWCETCYPFGDVKRIVQQLRSAVRAHRKGILRCDLCNWQYPYHVPGCLNAGPGTPVDASGRVEEVRR